jgi:exosortase
MSDAILPTATDLEPTVAGRTVVPASLGRWQRLGLALIAVELVVLFAPTVAWLYDRWTLSVWHNAHGLMIPFVVAYLAYNELKPLARRPAQSSAWGFAFLVPALILQSIDAGMHTQLLSAVAIWIAVPGLSLLLLGAERTRAIAFPLAFLAFALPIPLGLTEQIHLQLRHVVTAGTAAIVPWFGIPVFVEGTTLHMASGSLQVADACSGFSTLYAAAAVACLTAWSAQTTTRRVLVLVAAAPLAIAANLLRVTLLVLLVVWYGEDILHTFIHPASGMMTFGLALPVIFWLGGDVRPRHDAPTSEPS